MGSVRWSGFPNDRHAFSVPGSGSGTSSSYKLYTVPVLLSPIIFERSQKLELP